MSPHKTFRRALLTVLSAIVCAIAFSTTRARAELIAYEPFNYAPGADLSGFGATNTTGFSSFWLGDGTLDIAPGGLLGISTEAGGHVTGDAFGANRGNDRLLAQSMGANGTTRYFGFTMRAEDTVGQGAFGGWFAFALRAGVRNITVGKATNQPNYKVESNFGDAALSTIPIISNVTHFFVLRADFRQGADIYKLYIDPTFPGLEPAAASATLSTFDLGTVTAIGLAGPGAFGFDELRIGSTWQDVQPVPEPSNLIALIAAGVLFGTIAIRRAARIHT